MTAEKVHEAKVGPVRAVLLAEGPALALFKPAIRNTIVRTALKAGGNLWIDVFLGKRFGPYAYRIGYYVSRKWRQFKERGMGQAVPFVGFTPSGGGRIAPRWKQRNGEKMKVAAIKGARIAVTATQTKARITFSIPFGHPIQSTTSAQFRTLPSWEVERVAQATAKELQLILDGVLPATFIRTPKPRVVGPIPQVRATGVRTERTTGSGQRAA